MTLNQAAKMTKLHRSSILTIATSTSQLETLLRSLHPVVCARPLIRLGPRTDGGYILPDDLDGISQCFSPGVSSQVGFETACADLGMQVFLADASVPPPNPMHANFVFDHAYIGSRTKNDWLNINDWIARYANATGDLLLQMDIEGYEYESLLALKPKLLGRFRILIIEFHYLDLLFGEIAFQMVDALFERILEMFDCVHIHPNNYAIPVTRDGVAIPPLAEFTFLRKDRMREPRSYVSHFPHKLDCDNVPENISITLPTSMWRSPTEQWNIK